MYNQNIDQTVVVAVPGSVRIVKGFQQKWPIFVVSLLAKAA